MTSNQKYIQNEMILIFYSGNFGTLKIQISQKMRKLVNLTSMHPLLASIDPLDDLKSKMFIK